MRAIDATDCNTVDEMATAIPLTESVHTCAASSAGDRDTLLRLHLQDLERLYVATALAAPYARIIPITAPPAVDGHDKLRQNNPLRGTKRPVRQSVASGGRCNGNTHNFCESMMKRTENRIEYDKSMLRETEETLCTFILAVRISSI